MSRRKQSNPRQIKRESLAARCSLSHAPPLFILFYGFIHFNDYIPVLMA